MCRLPKLLDMRAGDDEHTWTKPKPRIAAAPLTQPTLTTETAGSPESVAAIFILVTPSHNR